MNANVNLGAEKHDGALTDMAAAEEMLTTQRAANRDVRDLPVDTHNRDGRSEDKQLVPLFLSDVATDFRSRWDAVQRGFVDDPKQAVRQGDELVTHVMKSLADTFSSERAKLEAELGQTDKASTETLRVTLRRYHSFFERLLSL
jgi:hypothetical protein